MNTNDNITVEELIKLFLKKINVNESYLDNHVFVFKGTTINNNEKSTLSKYGLSHGDMIKVVSTQNVVGGER